MGRRLESVLLGILVSGCAAGPEAQMPAGAGYGGIARIEILAHGME